MADKVNKQSETYTLGFEGHCGIAKMYSKGTPNGLRDTEARSQK